MTIYLRGHYLLKVYMFSLEVYIYNKKNGPFIIELLQLENNLADLFDGEDRMHFESD